MATAVEYGLIAALVGVIGVSAIAPQVFAPPREQTPAAIARTPEPAARVLEHDVPYECPAGYWLREIGDRSEAPDRMICTANTRLP